MADWSLLVGDLVVKIGEKLNLHTDYDRFRSVCVDWRNSLPEKIKPMFQGLPSLILPPNYNDQDNNNNNSQTCRGFLSLFDSNIYSLELPEEVATQHDLLFRGCSHGWIIAVGSTPSIYLINPLYNAQLMQLPPMTTFPHILDYEPNRVEEEYRAIEPWCEWMDEEPDEYTKSGDSGDYYNEYFECSEWMRTIFIHKVVLSSSPNSEDNYIAMAIYGRTARLAFCERGNCGWTCFDKDYGDNKDYGDEYRDFRDIIFCKDRFYVVNDRAQVYTVTLSDLLDSSSSTSSPPTTILQHITTVPSARRVYYRNTKLYLVESSENLLLVSRHCINIADDRRTTHFCVFKLNLDSSSTTTCEVDGLDTCELDGLDDCEVDGLGDGALFLGFNDSVCLPSRIFPPGSNYKRNCIYFTDDFVERHEPGADIGVFDYESETVNPLPGFNRHTDLVLPPPIWWFPSNAARRGGDLSSALSRF